MVGIVGNRGADTRAYRSDRARILLPLYANLIVGLLVTGTIIIFVAFPNGTGWTVLNSPPALLPLGLSCLLGVLQSAAWSRYGRVTYLVRHDAIEVLDARTRTPDRTVQFSDVESAAFSRGGTTVYRTLFGHGWLPPRLLLTLKDGGTITFKPILLDAKRVGTLEAHINRSIRHSS